MKKLRRGKHRVGITTSRKKEHGVRMKPLGRWKQVLRNKKQIFGCWSGFKERKRCRGKKRKRNIEEPKKKPSIFFFFISHLI